MGTVDPVQRLGGVAWGKIIGLFKGAGIGTRISDTGGLVFREPRVVTHSDDFDAGIKKFSNGRFVARNHAFSRRVRFGVGQHGGYRFRDEVQHVVHGSVVELLAVVRPA